MTNQFDELFENFYPTSMKLITRTIYPKEMKFSDEFVEALNKEYARLKVVEENGESRPVKNLEEKFVKAIKFRINGMKDAPIVEPEPEESFEIDTEEPEAKTNKE